MTKRRSRKAEHAALRRQAHKDGTYDRLLALQGGGCAICGRPPGTRKHHIDHDHKTMRIRGVLCFRCNFHLRSWVTVAWLHAAADYLWNSPYRRLEEETK